MLCILESQVPVALTAKYLEGRLCSGISGNGEYISTAIRSIHTSLNSYYLHSKIHTSLNSYYLHSKIHTSLNSYYLHSKIHTSLNSYYLHSKILSNNEMLGSETLTSGTAMVIESLVDDWPLHIRRCPLSDWSGLTLLSQLCIHCYKDSFYFDDE